MKHQLLIFFLALVSLSAAAQKQITLNENFVTQIIFESDIEFTRLAAPDDFSEPQQHKNILFLQPLSEFTPSNINVVCYDGTTYSLRLIYTTAVIDDYYLISSTEAINKIKVSTHTVYEKTNSERTVFQRILENPGFITSRNMVKYKSSYLFMSGIYVHENSVYIRLGVENKSEIPYQIDGVLFSLKVKSSKEIVTSADEIMTPIDKFIPSETVESQKQVELVFKFDKFTIGKEHYLQIDCIENGGARNLSLQINDDIFLQAKQL